MRTGDLFPCPALSGSYSCGSSSLVRAIWSDSSRSKDTMPLISVGGTRVSSTDLTLSRGEFGQLRAWQSRANGETGLSRWLVWLVTLTLREFPLRSLPPFSAGEESNRQSDSRCSSISGSRVRDGLGGGELLGRSDPGSSLAPLSLFDLFIIFPCMYRVTP